MSRTTGAGPQGMTAERLAHCEACRCYQCLDDLLAEVERLRTENAANVRRCAEIAQRRATLNLEASKIPGISIETKSMLACEATESETLDRAIRCEFPECFPEGK